MTEREQTDADLWSGVDLSGIVLVLGFGTGQLVQLLAEEALRAGGAVLLAGHSRATLASWHERVVGLPAVELLCCRYRELPLADASVDLCVINGTLREVPVPHYRTQLEEIWRVLVPGGQLRVSDLLAPSAEPYGRAWRARCELITHLGEALGKPVALNADVQALAVAMRAVGFESMAVSLLPGLALTDEWLGDTVEAVQTMASRVADSGVRRSLLETDVAALVSAYRAGRQRAAERFTMRGSKVGNLALDMETAGTAQVLAARVDDAQEESGSDVDDSDGGSSEGLAL